MPETFSQLPVAARDMAEAVWFESQRFDLKPVERVVLGLVNDLTTRVGRAEVLGASWMREFGGRAWNTPAKSLALAAESMARNRILLALDCGGQQWRLGINFDFENWGCTQVCSSQAHWAARNEMHRRLGLPEWLLAPERGLVEALRETHRENFAGTLRVPIAPGGGAAAGGGLAGSCGGAPDARVFPDSGISGARMIPNFGIIPDFGKRFKTGDDFGAGEKCSTKTRVSCANGNLAGDGQLTRARARGLNVKRVNDIKRSTLNGFDLAEEARVLGLIKDFCGADELVSSGGFWRKVMRHDGLAAIISALGEGACRVEAGQQFDRSRGAWLNWEVADYLQLNHRDSERWAKYFQGISLKQS